jgi:hypothetical protein
MQLHCSTNRFASYPMGTGDPFPGGKAAGVWRWPLTSNYRSCKVKKTWIYISIPPAFYGTRSFNTVFTRALHWSLSWAISIQSNPSHPISLRSKVLVFPAVSFLLAFPPISYMHSSSPHSCYMPRPSHPFWLYHSNYTWRRVQVMKYMTVSHNRLIKVMWFLESEIMMMYFQYQGWHHWCTSLLVAEQVYGDVITFLYQLMIGYYLFMVNLIELRLFSVE